MKRFFLLIASFIVIKVHNVYTMEMMEEEKQNKQISFLDTDIIYPVYLNDGYIQSHIFHKDINSNDEVARLNWSQKDNCYKMIIDNKIDILKENNIIMKELSSENIGKAFYYVNNTKKLNKIFFQAENDFTEINYFKLSFDYQLKKINLKENKKYKNILSAMENMMKEQEEKALIFAEKQRLEIEKKARFNGFIMRSPLYKNFYNQFITKDQKPFGKK